MGLQENQIVINDIMHKIEREHVLIQGAQAMSLSTDNHAVRLRLEAEIRESKKNISYLEDRLTRILPKASQSELNISSDRPAVTKLNEHSSPNINTAGGSKFPKRREIPRKDNAPQPPPKDLQCPSMPEEDQFLDSSQNMRKRKPPLSKLDLIKYNTPLNGAKIQHMLQQLQFKLEIEKQYREGIEKMSKLYGMEGDRKAKAEAESNLVQSSQKIQLLKQALKRYEALNIDASADDEVADDDSLSAHNMRRPASGTLHVRISSVWDVDHTSTSRFTKGPETFIVIKVEDIPKQRTRTSRNDRWFEDFEIPISKANEVEFTVCDKVGDEIIPIGLLWVRISDIIEELRRRKVDQGMAESGWVKADKLGERFDHDPSRLSSQQTRLTQKLQDIQLTNLKGIEDWFSLEPTGQILISLNFHKDNKDQRMVETGGLARQGAIRQRKEEVHEMYGHKFVKQQFYQIMRCAFCGEFLKNAIGYQCEDCRYTCHKDCYTKVVTKCISKTNAETDPEEKLNHRIPHRFGPFTNMSANWCNHCGYILPLGKKNARRCTECSLTCHAQCAHLIPDFCGISNEMARNILDGIRLTKHTIASGTAMSNRNFRSNRATAVQTDLAQTKSPRSLWLDEKTSSPGRSIGLKGESEASKVAPQAHGKNAVSDISPVTYTGGLSAAQAVYGVKQSPELYAIKHPVVSLRPERPATPNRTASAIAAAAALAGATKADKAIPRSHFNDRRPNERAHLNVYQKEIKIQKDFLPQSTQPMKPTQPMKSTSEPDRNLYPAAILGVGSSQQQIKTTVQVLTKRKVGLDDFNFLAVLGKGNFGKVMLAEAKQSKRLFAIKVLKKEFIIENDEVESTRSEKRVFMIANREKHPFLLNLHSCFQTETRIYFVMEYVSGGDLMLHIQREQFSPRRAQFYAAEVLLALKYFHENGIVYRDLKLDNILLALDGHIKIADYGLCKEEMWYGNTTSTFCGTPEFMAPEILLEQRYTRAVDWWAFGVLIYQMLLGQSPFRGDDEDEIFDAILSDEPLYPIHMPRDSVSILQKLLTREPSRRLGAGTSDAEEIMAHPFFRNIDWDEIYHKRVQPPFVPQLSSSHDTSNFDQEFTREIPVLTPVQSVLTTAQQEAFRGFSALCDETL